MRQDTIADRGTDRHAVARMHTIRRKSFVVNPGVERAIGRCGAESGCYRTVT